MEPLGGEAQATYNTTDSEWDTTAQTFQKHTVTVDSYVMRLLNSLIPIILYQSQQHIMQVPNIFNVPHTLQLPAVLELVRTSKDFT